MLPESAEKMGTELNGTAVKSEVKVEIKEEPMEEKRNLESITTNPSGPPSNKLTNGETGLYPNSPGPHNNKLTYAETGLYPTPQDYPITN
jgi:hypothetical protein